MAIFSVNKTLANNCQNIGEVGTSGSCNGKLIVSRENLIDAISDGNNLEAEDEFKNLIAGKVGDALEVKRAELANTFVNNGAFSSEED